MEKKLMPVLFVGHGSPMNAVEENFYTSEWKKMVKNIPTPNAILCISAHWLTRGSYILASHKPKTIHDMYGFPRSLYEVTYPAPGAPEYAKELNEKENKIQLDYDWGFDHGAWSVLKHMFPQADIQVFQLSIDFYQSPQYHFDLAKQLRYLRKKGVLIIGSGNIVHNLRTVKFEDRAYDWAVEFDEKVKSNIINREFGNIIDYQKMGNASRLAVPTPDHYFPLLYTLGVIDKNEEIEFYSEKTTMGSVSMRSLAIN